MKAWLRIAAIAATLMLCLPLHYGWRLIGRRSPIPRFFLGSVGYIAGIRRKIIGTPLTSNVLFVSNHLSWVDIMIVAGATGSAFVSKEEVRDWPLIGWLAGLNDTVFVARTDRRSVHGQTGALRAALISGRAVTLFPEGTTKGGLALLPFRASLFEAVQPPGDVRIQPVAIDYGPAASAIAWTGEESAPANALRVLGRPGTADVILHFLDPIDPADFGNRKALAEAARDRIAQTLHASADTGDRL